MCADEVLLPRVAAQVSGSVWLATDFPISMEQFMPVLDALAVHHNPMKRLKDLVSELHLADAQPP